MLYDVYDMQTKLTICSIVFFSECKKEVDIVIVLDGSNSIFPWPHIRGFLHRFIEKIEIGPKLSQVSCVLKWTCVLNILMCAAVESNVEKRFGYVTVE